MKFVNVFSDGDLIPSKPKNFDCDSYLQSKSTYKVPKTLQDQVKSKFDIIHSDVHGPLAAQLLRRKRYFITFFDEFSRYTWIYVVQHKSDVKTVFQTFYNLVETEFFAKIKNLKTDNGGEYVNKEMTVFWKRTALSMTYHYHMHTKVLVYLNMLITT
jgi:hypothetical protein